MTDVLTAGAEFSVNTNTANNQTGPSITSLSDGGFVVVWTTMDPTQDGSDYSVKAQRFDASGHPVGAEFLVNSQTANYQSTPDVAAFSNGGFVVTWVTGDTTQDGDSTAIKAQIFDANGNPAGSEFLVNSLTANRQDDPHITVLDNGNFVVTWNDWAGFDMMAQVFSPDGQKVGGQFRVNSSTSGFQEYGDVTALDGGGFVVTWRTTDTTADGSGQAVMARVYDASGVGGPEFLVNTAKVDNQYDPSITALNNGGFVVVWQTLNTAQDGSGSALKAQLYDATGAPVGGEFLVNSQAKDGQQGPVVSALPNGGFVVVWETLDPLQDGNSMAVKAQYFDSTGHAVGSEFLVNSITSGAQFLPSVTTLADGTVAVVWTSSVGDGTGNGVRGRLFDMNSSPQIVSDGGGAAAAVSVSEGQTSATSVVATDDSGHVTYSISGGADAALFAIDSATGALTFVTTPDYENPTDAGRNNVYEVVVAASDGQLTDSQAISVTVSNVNEAPVLAGGTTLSLTQAENVAAVATISATDVDGPSIQYAIAGGNDADLFTIDPNTGVLYFVNAPDFEAPADLGEDNFYTLTVSASDGTNTVEQRVEVLVTNQNEGVSITSGGGGDSASVSVSENGSAVTTVTATDLDGDAVTYSIVGGADADRFTIDATTGALAFVSSPNFEGATDADHDNVYDVVVQASDGSLTDQQSLSVTVTNVNEAPQITSGGGGNSAVYAVNENTTAVGTITSTDPDGGARTYSISGGADASLFTIDATSGALSFVTGPNFEAPADAGGNNVYDIVVTSSDGSLTDSQALAISVGNVVDGITLTGTNGGNTLAGTAAEDSLFGLGGNDTLIGGGGADILDGGKGNDTLTGGLGSDRLTGGDGQDVFAFTSVSDSLPGASDIITDFSRSNHDRISLSGIDANLNAAGDQSFAFIGSGAFTGVAGQLRYQQTGGNTFVMGDVNGDGVADFVIQVNGPVTLTHGDFIL